MNYENKAGVYARPGSRDQLRSSHQRCSVKKGSEKICKTQNTLGNMDVMKLRSNDFHQLFKTVTRGF